MACTDALPWTLGSSLYFGAFVSLGQPQPYTVKTVAGSTTLINVTCSTAWKVGDKIVLCTGQCVTAANQCLTVTAVSSIPASGSTATIQTVTVNAALEVANTGGWAFRPANLKGFRLDFEYGEDCADLLGVAAINKDSDMVAIQGRYSIGAGATLTVPGVVQAKVLSSRTMAGELGSFTVATLADRASATVDIQSGTYARITLSEQQTAYGGSSGECGFAFVQTRVLSGYPRGVTIPGRLRLSRGWDYSTFNRRTGCNVKPSNGWAQDLWCGKISVC